LHETLGLELRNLAAHGGDTYAEMSRYVRGSLRAGRLESSKDPVERAVEPDAHPGDETLPNPGAVPPSEEVGEGGFNPTELGGSCGHGRMISVVCSKQLSKRPDLRLRRYSCRPPERKLAVLPGTSHVTVVYRADLLLATIPPFLDAPMSEGA
jgi:hypothetical protein